MDEDDDDDDDHERGLLCVDSSSITSHPGSSPRSFALVCIEFCSLPSTLPLFADPLVELRSHSTFDHGAIHDHLKALARRGQIVDAIGLLERLERFGIPTSQGTYICVLQDCIYYKAYSEAKDIHASIRRNHIKPDINLGNTLINLYLKCNDLEEAHLVFDSMPERNVFTWTLLIGGYTKLGYSEDALALFWKMVEEEVVKPNKYTFLAAVKACCTIEQCEQMHLCIIRFRMESDNFMRSTLIDMYARCGSIDLAQHVFHKIPGQDIVTWNSMISAYLQHGRCDSGLMLFQQLQQEGLDPDEVTFVIIVKACTTTGSLKQGKFIHCCIKEHMMEPSTALGNALLDMYAKCESFTSAADVFSKMDRPNVISWTTMIEAYIQNGFSEDALMFFWKMQREMVVPDGVAYVSAAKASAELASLEQGKQVHCCLIKHGFKPSRLLENTLIDMYAKCGSMDFAWHIFDNMHERDTISWSAIVSGFALHGYAAEALSLIEQMVCGGIELDHITIVGALSACSHAGLIKEGICYFKFITQELGFTPTGEHYACLVNMLTRAGRLEEVVDFIYGSDCPSNEEIWTSVLMACRNMGEITLAKQAADHLLDVKPKSTAAFVLLSNIYAEAGRWEERARVRKAMEEGWMGSLCSK